jgi:acetylornithine deacetylase
MDKDSVHIPSLEEIQTALQARREWGLKALQRLVSIDSISPHEEECQQALAGILDSEGVQVELVPLDDGTLRSVDGFVDAGLPLENRPNLVATYGGVRKGGRSLILNGHIDTVSWLDQLAKWKVHPLSGDIVDGKLYGRGSIDDKGPVMAAATAILVLKDIGYEPAGKVSLTSVVGEEPSGNGTLALCSQGYLADGAINLEPTDNDVVYGHRGIIGLRYQILGEARHSSVGSQQANAIVETGCLGRVFLKSLDAWEDPSDKLYGFPSLNVGRIEGGEDIFTTPENCQLDCCIRYAPGTYEKILDCVKNYLRIEGPKVLDDFDRVRNEVFAHYDAAETDPADPLVKTMISCVRTVEPDRGLRTFPGGCDARHLINRYNIPTLIFGPGQLHLAHAENEHLILDQWILAVQEIALFITRWCEGS